MSAAELSAHVRGIAEKLRKRAEDASKKHGSEASAGLLVSVEHLLQSAQLMERQQQQLQAAGSSPGSLKEMPTVLRNLQLVAAMLEKKSDEMKSKQAMGPANSLATSASHVRIGIDRLLFVQTWLHEQLRDAFSTEMDWIDAFKQVEAHKPSKNESNDLDIALKASEATISTLQAELEQWKQHHEASRAQQVELMQSWERKEAELNSALERSSSNARQVEALEAALAEERSLSKKLQLDMEALQAHTAKVEQEMQEEWERAVKKSNSLQQQIEELQAKTEAQHQVSVTLSEQLEEESRTVLALKGELSVAKENTEKNKLAEMALVEEFEGKIQALEQALVDKDEALNGAKASEDEANEHLTAKIKTLENELKDIQGELAAAKAAAEKNHAEMVKIEAAAKKEAEVRHKKNLELEQELINVRRQLANAEDDAEKRRLDVQALENEVAAVRRGSILDEDDAQRSRQKIRALEDELTAVRADVAQLEQHLQRAGDDGDTFQAYKTDKVLQLVDSIRRLNDEKAQAKAEVERLQTAHGSAGEQVTQLADAVKTLQAEKAHFEAEIARLETRVATEQRAAKLHLEQVAVLEAQVDKTAQLHTEMRVSHEEAGMAMQETVGKIKDDLVNSRRELQRLEAEKTDWEEREKSIQAELESTKERLNKIDDARSALEISNVELMERCVASAAQAAEFEAQVESLKHQLLEMEETTTATEELDKLKAQVDAIAAEKADAISKLEEELAKWESQQKVLEEQINDLTEQLNAANASNGEDKQQLNDQITALTEQLSGLEEEKVSALNIAQELRLANAHFEAQVNTSQLRYDELAAELQEREKSVEEWTSCKEALLVEKTQLEATIASLNQDLASAQDKISELEFEKLELVELKERTMETLAKHQEFEAKSAEKVQEFVDKINALVNEKTSLESEVKDKNEALERVQNELQAAEAEKLRIIDDHQRHVLNLTNDQKSKELLEELQAEKDAVVAGKQANIDALTAQITDLKSQVENATQSVSELTDRIQASEKERETQQKQFDELEGQLMAVHAGELKHLANQLADLQAEKLALQSDFSAQTEKLAEEIESSQRSAGQIQELMVKINAITSEKAQTQAHSQALEEKISTLEAEKQAIHSQIGELNEKCQLLQTQLQELETEKATIVEDLEAKTTAEAISQEKAKTLQETVDQMQQRVVELEAQQVAAATSQAAANALKEAFAERDSIQTKLTEVETAFEAYKTKAAAALKKAEKRTALLNPMLAEKQQLEFRLTALETERRQVEEKHAAELLGKEDAISRLSALVAEATERAKTIEDIENAVQAAVQAKDVELSSSLESWKAREKELEDEIAEKDSAVAATADELAKTQAEFATLKETLELKTLAVTKCLQEKEAFAATQGELRQRLEEFIQQLNALQKAEVEWKTEKEVFVNQVQALEASLEELKQDGQSQLLIQDLTAQLENASKSIDEINAAKTDAENKLVHIKAELEASVLELAELKKVLESQAKDVAEPRQNGSLVSQSLVEAEKVALEASWKTKLNELQVQLQSAEIKYQEEKASLSSTISLLEHQIKQKEDFVSQNVQVPHHMQVQLVAKDEEIAELKRRLEMEAANEKLAFEATKLLKSQLEEKDNFIALLKQNGELKLNQVKQDVENHWKNVLQEREITISALEQQLPGKPVNDQASEIAHFKSQVAQLLQENESLKKQTPSTVEVDVTSLKEQIAKLQQDNTKYIQSMQSLKETLNEKLHQLATIKAPIHVKTMDELAYAIDHEQRAFAERKELHTIQMSKLKRDAQAWLEIAQAKLEEHTRLQDAIHEKSPPTDDVVVNPLEETLVLKSGVNIKAGSLFELPVVCSPGQTIQWSFRIEEADTDINFALTFGDDDDVVPITRVERLEGTFQVKAPGMLKFEWDNSFSWLNPKTLDYHVSVFEPLTEEALARRKEQEVLKIKIAHLHDRLSLMGKEDQLMDEFGSVLDTPLPSAIELYLEECMAHREMVVVPQLSQVQEKMNALKNMINMYVEEQQELTEATASLAMMLEEVHQERRDLQNTCHLHKTREETIATVQAQLGALEAELQSQS
ncbi:unnamed protein product [Aphanomyces euteiches]